MQAKIDKIYSKIENIKSNSENVNFEINFNQMIVFLKENLHKFSQGDKTKHNEYVDISIKTACVALQSDYSLTEEIIKLLTYIGSHFIKICNVSIIYLFLLFFIIFFLISWTLQFHI